MSQYDIQEVKRKINTCCVSQKDIQELELKKTCRDNLIQQVLYDNQPSVEVLKRELSNLNVRLNAAKHLLKLQEEEKARQEAEIKQFHF